MRRRAAVVGGGIFGVSAALELARLAEVDLFEQTADLLQAASGINQYRLHRGYHYPRSPETAQAARDGEATFREVWGEAVVDAADHYYCIARDGSLTSPEAFLTFCDRLGLWYRCETPPQLEASEVALSVRVRESLIDPGALRALAWHRLRACGVNVHPGLRVCRDQLEAYDAVVVATYATLNELVPPDSPARSDYQFEVCEKIVIEARPDFARLSVVVLDGPFLCVDPFGSTGLSVMGNVVHAIYATNVGTLPVIPEAVAPLLNRGVIADPPVTRFEAFRREASRFLPELGDARHVGSMFTIRAVLPNRDATDERPTLVRQVDERTISVFSGKIVNCVDAARDIARQLEGRLA